MNSWRGAVSAEKEDEEEEGHSDPERGQASVSSRKQMATNLWLSLLVVLCTFWHRHWLLYFCRGRG